MTGVNTANLNSPYINPTIQTFSAVGLVLGWGGDLLPLQGPEIPKGYELTIALLYDDVGNVTGATFTVTDNQGKTYPIKGLLSSISNFKNGDLAPIVGFQFQFNGATGNVLSIPGFLGGVLPPQVPVGTITYSASSPMTVWSLPPLCAGTVTKSAVPGGGSVVSFWVTQETTNGFYGVLAPAQGPSTTFTQAFGVSVPRERNLPRGGVE
jgi:hypothetical protein